MKKNTINYPKSAVTGFFSKGFKNEFETAVVNEPSVFEPLKFYCIFLGAQKSSGSVVDDTLDYQSRSRKIEPHSSGLTFG